MPEHADAVHPTLRGWSRGEHLWLRRAAIICQRRLKPRQVNAPLLHEAISHSIGARPLARGFFLRRGIGCVLRERSYAAPSEVVAFCRVYADQLTPLTLRDALRVVRQRGLA